MFVAASEIGGIEVRLAFYRGFERVQGEPLDFPWPRARPPDERGALPWPAARRSPALLRYAPQSSGARAASMRWCRGRLQRGGRR